jgi:hypothetical protein
VKAATGVLTALGGEDTPLRPALGYDALDAITARAEAARVEARAWESVSRRTDHSINPGSDLPLAHSSGCPRRAAPAIRPVTGPPLTVRRRRLIPSRTA